MLENFKCFKIDWREGDQQPTSVRLSWWWWSRADKFPSCLLVDLIPYPPTKFTLDEILRKFNSDVFFLSPLFDLPLQWVVVLILLSSYTDTSLSKRCLTNMNHVMSMNFSSRLVKFSVDGAGYSLQTKALYPLPLPDVLFCCHMFGHVQEVDEPRGRGNLKPLPNIRTCLWVSWSVIRLQVISQALLCVGISGWQIKSSN